MTKDIVVYVILDKGKVLLEQRKDDDPYGGLWAFPSGHVETDDKVGALLKEVQEETGLVTEKYMFLGNMDFESDDDKSLLHIFVIVKFIGDAKERTDEGRELKWFIFNEARNVFNSGTEFHKTSLVVLEKVMEISKKLEEEK